MKSPQNSPLFFLKDFAAKISEAILQFRYDCKNLKMFQNNNNAKAQSPSANLNFDSTHENSRNLSSFQLFLKEIYKTRENLFLNNMERKFYIIIDFFLHRKSDNQRFMVEHWVFELDFLEGEEKEEMNLIFGRLAIFLRSLLIVLINTPMFFIYANNSSGLKNKLFMDHKLSLKLENEGINSKEFKLIEKEIKISEMIKIKLQTFFISELEKFVAFELLPAKNFKGRSRFFSEGVQNLKNGAEKKKSDFSTTGESENSVIMKNSSEKTLKTKRNSIDVCSEKDLFSPKQRNLMSRKDSLILNSKEKNIKVFDDEGEEIEVEYFEHNIREKMDVIKEQHEKDENEYFFFDENLVKEDHYDDDVIVISKPKTNHFKNEVFIKKMKEIQIKIKDLNNENNVMELDQEIDCFFCEITNCEKINQ